MNPDLTADRYKLLLRARELISSKMPARNADSVQIPDSENVFADVNINCELKIRAHGQVLSFDSDTVLKQHVEDIFS